MNKQLTGVELIAEERKRQIEVEGWTPQHDAQHKADELAIAAACYALPQHKRKYRGWKKMKALVDLIPKLWPWENRWWKPSPHDRVRELVKAGALIAAEIDRINNTKADQ